VGSVGFFRSVFVGRLARGTEVPLNELKTTNKERVLNMKSLTNLFKTLTSWGSAKIEVEGKDYIVMAFSGDYLRSQSSTGDTGWTNLTPFSLSKAGQMIQPQGSDRKYFVRIGISVPPGWNFHRISLKRDSLEHREVQSLSVFLFFQPLM